MRSPGIGIYEMNYYTTFTLSILSQHSPDIRMFKTVLEEIIDDPELVEFDIDGNTLVATSTWDSHDEDCLVLSSKFPNYIFQLEGEGANRNDLWRSYYVNGKCQISPAIVKVTYEPYNPNKLTTLEEAHMNAFAATVENL